MTVEAVNSFPHLPDCHHIDVDDKALLSELRDVLDRHGATDRFGISLLHRHFDLNEGEMLVETTDIGSRTLTIQPQNKGPDADLAVPTQWRFVSDDRIIEPTQVCFGFGHNKGS